MICLEDGDAVFDVMQIQLDSAQSFDAPMIGLEEEPGAHLESPLQSQLGHDDGPLPQPYVHPPSVPESSRKSSTTARRKRPGRNLTPTAMKRPCDVDRAFRTYCSTVGISSADSVTPFFCPIGFVLAAFARTRETQL